MKDTDECGRDRDGNGDEDGDDGEDGGEEERRRQVGPGT